MKPLALEPGEYSRRNFAVRTSGFESSDVLGLVIKSAGIDNEMWAVDYPYENSRDAVAFVEGASLTGIGRASIFHRNAERLFQVDMRHPDFACGAAPTFLRFIGQILFVEYYDRGVSS